MNCEAFSNDLFAMGEYSWISQQESIRQLAPSAHNIVLHVHSSFYNDQPWFKTRLGRYVDIIWTFYGNETNCSPTGS
jgi:hypothetical protein